MIYLSAFIRILFIKIHNTHWHSSFLNSKFWPHYCTYITFFVVNKYLALFLLFQSSQPLFQLSLLLQHLQITLSDLFEYIHFCCQGCETCSHQEGTDAWKKSCTSTGWTGGCREWSLGHCCRWNGSLKQRKSKQGMNLWDIILMKWVDMGHGRSWCVNNTVCWTFCHCSHHT